MIKLTIQELSVEEFIELTSESIIKKILFHVQQPEKQEVYLTRNEAAKLLQLSLPTLSEYCKRGLIPSYRVGSNIRFKKSEIEQLVSDGLRFKYKRNGGVK